MNFTKTTARQFVRECERELRNDFERVDDIALHNQEKVLKAFQNNGIQARHMFGTTGYGYDDIGRDTLARVFAEVLGAESALVSPHIVSGTHALTLMLFGVLRPNDTLLAVSGMPYDTLCDVISGENKGSLADYGVNFGVVELKTVDKQPVFDFDEIENRLKSQKIKAVFVARSRGYCWRSAISVEQIAELVKFVKKISPETLVIVDNCYGAQ